MPCSRRYAPPPPVGGGAGLFVGGQVLQLLGGGERPTTPGTTLTRTRSRHRLILDHRCCRHYEPSESRPASDGLAMNRWPQLSLTRRGTGTPGSFERPPLRATQDRGDGGPGVIGRGADGRMGSDRRWLRRRHQRGGYRVATAAVAAGPWVHFGSLDEAPKFRPTVLDALRQRIAHREVQ